MPIRTVTLDVTHRCHRHCGFCYLPCRAASDSSPDAELPADELGRLVRHVAVATGCRHVQLSGGEPLLRPDLLQIVDAVAEVVPRLSIITDGAGLDAPLARSLAAHGVRMLQPTLMAGTAELHDSLRGQGAFRDATRAIATAAAAGIDVSVCMVVTRLNFAEAGRIAELSFALGARGLALSRFCSVRTSAPFLPDATQVRAAAELAASACSDLGLPLAAAVPIPRCVWDDPDRPPLRVGVCSLVGPTTTVTIGPDGAVRSCALSAQLIGNVRYEPWEVLARRLWENELRPLRQPMSEPCRSCADFARCLGGCRLSGRAAGRARGYRDPLARHGVAEP